MKDVTLEALTKEDAEKVLNLDADKRRKDCTDEIAEVLKKYNCTLVGEVTFSTHSQTPVWNVSVVPVKG